MAIGTGVTEIADSEEESLTSSPAAVSDATIDKLSPTAGQDVQAVAYPHQEVAAHTANEALGGTGALGVDQKNSSTDLGKTRSDQSELHSAHEAATNNVSACTVDTAQSADGKLQDLDGAVVGPKQSDRSVTARTDDEAGSPRDKGILPGATLAPELDERANLQLNQQNHPLALDEKSQHHLQDPPISTSGSTGLQRDKLSKNHPQDLAVDGHITEMRLPLSDLTQPTSSERKLVEVDNASTVSQKDSAAAAVTTRPDCETVREATITTPNAASTHYPKVAVAGQTAPDTASKPGSMDLNVTYRAVDVASVGGNKGDSKVAIEPCATDDATTSSEESQHTTQLAATSVPPVDVGRTDGCEDPEANDGASIAPGSRAQSRTTADNSRLSDHYGHNITIATNESVEAEVGLSQNLTAAPNEQDRTNPSTNSAREEIAMPRSEVVLQSAGGDVQGRGDSDSFTRNDELPASMASAVQTESQSTASQASEPASPLPAEKLSPQEITLAELRAQKAALLSSLKVQPAVQVLMEGNDDDDGEPTEKDIMTAANRIVKEHIKLLHEYNELKDVGQGLMGLIADQRGARIVEIQDEFGIDTND